MMVRDFISHYIDVSDTHVHCMCSDVQVRHEYACQGLHFSVDLLV